MATMPFAVNSEPEVDQFQKPRSRSFVIPLLWILVLIIALLTGFFLGRFSKTAPTAQTPAAVTTQSTAPPAVLPPVVADINVVHSGEGIESPLIRQLIADPSLAGFSGNRDDARAVKQWAGRQAHLLAIKAGFVEWKFGEEMRVKYPGVSAFRIEKDSTGKLTIVEYAVSSMMSAGASGYSQVSVHQVAATVTTSHFIGPMDGTTHFQTAYMSMYSF
jgi:hypothetical protein